MAVDVLTNLVADDVVVAFVVPNSNVVAVNCIRAVSWPSSIVLPLLLVLFILAINVNPTSHLCVCVSVCVY